MINHTEDELKRLKDELKKAEKERHILVKLELVCL